MSFEELNDRAVLLGEQAKETLTDRLVELDVSVAVAQHEHSELVRQAAEQRKATDFLWDERKLVSDGLYNLSEALRELKRPREGFPFFDDTQYESRMLELRLVVQDILEALIDS